MDLIIIAISASLINNVVMSQFLGICPFLGVSKKTGPALGMGAAVTFVMVMSSFVCFIIYAFILKPFDLEYLYIIAFILVVASLVQLCEIFIKRFSPTLYSALGVYLPLMVTNCAIVGVSIINMQSSYSFTASIVNAVFSGVGFTLAIVIFAGLREQIEHCDIPACFRGAPISLIAAGLMSIAFMGFAGI